MEQSTTRALYNSIPINFVLLFILLMKIVLYYWCQAFSILFTHIEVIEIDEGSSTYILVWDYGVCGGQTVNPLV